jgi:hypothetical protein
MPTALANMPVDEATGFIDSPQLNGFGIDAKRQFIKLMCETQGDASITAMSRELGFDPVTVLRHIQIDKAFAHEIQQAKTLFAHRVEGVLMSCALDPKKTLDRLAYLRAYMPERYARMELLAPASNIQITVNGSVSTKLNEVVDAELVKPESASITAEPTNNTHKAPHTSETVDSQ